jgi:hypothetical protein
MMQHGTHYRENLGRKPFRIWDPLAKNIIIHVNSTIKKHPLTFALPKKRMKLNNETHNHHFCQQNKFLNFLNMFAKVKCFNPLRKKRPSGYWDSEYGTLYRIWRGVQAAQSSSVSCYFLPFQKFQSSEAKTTGKPSSICSLRPFLQFKNEVKALHS